MTLQRADGDCIIRMNFIRATSLVFGFSNFNILTSNLLGELPRQHFWGETILSGVCCFGNGQPYLIKIWLRKLEWLCHNLNLVLLFKSAVCAFNLTMKYDYALKVSEKYGFIKLSK